jgi:hypothetical protein
MGIQFHSKSNFRGKILFVVLLYLFSAWNVCHSQDSLDYSYSIVGMAFYEDHDIIKIKVPPWLKTSELVPQIKRVLFWPGSSPPSKRTFIYVFKETDQIGESSNTGAIYIPKEGFIWNLTDWNPAKIPDSVPSESDIAVYYSLIDQIIENGSSLDNTMVKRRVAADYNLSIYQLDSIYSMVKFWLSKKQNNFPQTSEGK